MANPKKVLIVDDVPMVRQSIIDILAGERDFEIVGEASSGAQALRMIIDTEPDLITMDINMPGMSGITALKHLMINSPTPTVMISSLTQEGSGQAFESIRFGAVDFIPKLSKLDESDFADQQGSIMVKLRWAVNVDVSAIRYIPAAQKQLDRTAELADAQTLVAMGAAQGGYASLMKILPRLPENTPAAMFVVLYEHARYVDAFVSYIAAYCQIRVERAVDGAPLKAGVCYVSAGEDYVTLRHVGDGIGLHVHPAPFDSQRGSFNRLLYSATDMLNDNVVGVLLSGAGDDGAEGLAEVIRVGGVALVQSPATCLVREMAETAISYCGKDALICDDHVADQLVRILFSN